MSGKTRQLKITDDEYHCCLFHSLFNDAVLAAYDSQC